MNPDSGNLDTLVGLAVVTSK